MNEFQPLIEQLYREEILHARKMTPEQRIAAAFALAPLARSIMRDGIRAKNPGADEATLRQLESERIALARRLNEGDIYRPVEIPR